MKFTESQLEAAFIDLLEREGIVHVAGVGMARGPGEVLYMADKRLNGGLKLINYGSAKVGEVR